MLLAGVGARRAILARRRFARVHVHLPFVASPASWTLAAEREHAVHAHGAIEAREAGEGRAFVHVHFAVKASLVDRTRATRRSPRAARARTGAAARARGRVERVGGKLEARGGVAQMTAVPLT